MQCVITASRRRHGRAVGTHATDAERLSAAFGLRGFEVQILALPDGAQANQPDAIVMLRRGDEQVLVQAYAQIRGAVSQGAVRQLALDAFQAGAGRAMLIAAAGFTVAAHQAALHHDALELVDQAGLAALLGMDGASTQDTPSARPRLFRGETARPPWPVRAGIGVSGMALAVVMVFASMPSLQGRVFGPLHAARPTGTTFAQASTEAWRAPSRSRSGELELQPSLEWPGRPRQAASATAGNLPANFNQALSAPRL